MAFSLNMYCHYIATPSDTGVRLINNAMHYFKSPLIGTIRLLALDALKLTKALSNLANQYG
jgi:hypothetical protein